MAIPNNLSRFLLPVFQHIHDWVYEEDVDMKEICGRLVIDTLISYIYIWPYKKHMYLDKLIICVESKGKNKFYGQKYCPSCEHLNDLIVVYLLSEKKDFLVCKHNFDLDEITTS